MAMGPDRSTTKPLHNFALPPLLKWGAQRILPCKKLHPSSNDGGVGSADVAQPPSRSDRIEAIGERLMMDYKIAMEKVKVVGEKGPEKEEGLLRPWNLRTRRSPAPVPEPPAVERRRAVPVAVGAKRKGKEVVAGEEKVEFRVGLRKEEIEEDFLLMAGVKPARRPKKRPRVVQKELDTLFPGLWLTEVTPQQYDVPEAAE